MDYRIEIKDRGQWADAPGDATGWSFAEAERALAESLVGLDGEPIDASDVRIVPAPATPQAITLWLSFVGRGAPSNTAGSRTGLGRTKAEASRSAGHWANQAPWERFTRVEVRDLSSLPLDLEPAVWRELAECTDEYLPPTTAGREVALLAQHGLYASALLCLYAARDAGIELAEVTP